MFSRKKLIISVITLIIFTTNLALADWKENAKAIKVSGGEDHTLVLTQNNAVWVCGPNGGIGYFGVLGTGSTDPSLIETTLVRVHGGDMNTSSGYLEDINDIAAGWKHSLTLDVNDFVWAWGDNYCGQLGDNQQSGYHSSTPVQVHGVNNEGYLRHIIVISAGRSGEHSLAVDANNFVYAWGRNVEGQCGNGESGSGQKELTPVLVLKGEQDTSASDYLENIVAVSGGEQHSTGLEKIDPCDPNCKGHVYTWGDNAYGKLGIGDTYPSMVDTPVRVHKGEQASTSGWLENIVSVKAGWDHCVALEDYYPFDPNCKGRVYTWGNNLYGQLGNGDIDDNSTPVRVLKGQQNTSTSNYLEHIVAIAAGQAHSMALDINRNVYTWGSNYYGQLGDGTDDSCPTPVKVVGPDTNHNGIHEPNEGYLENIVAISAGFWHCLAIDENGNIWTWGEGDYGQLGTGDTAERRNIPHRIPVVYNITREKFYFGIQNALDDGDVIEASVGDYYEEIIFPSDKHIILKSSNPNNHGVVANTIIDGKNHSNVDPNNLITFNLNPGSTITGFTITGARWSGLACTDSSVSIKNCIIKNNQYEGIELDNSTANITNCCIQNNGQDWIESGIRIDGASSTTITNNIIRCNGEYGIYLQEVSAPTTIKNNWIHNNSSDGIYSDNVSTAPVIRNNTIVKNGGYGINCSSSTAPVISNCILWGNNTGQLNGCTATYPCFDDPVFMNPGDPNDLHISANSPCKDTGNPDGNYVGETDIDGEDRVKYGCVDIGGDEYYWSPADFNDDEIVNFIDYAIFAQAWDSNTSDPNWNPECDLADDDIIDYHDLDLFCEDWLWQAGWAKSFTCGAGEGMSQAMREGMSQTMTAALAPTVGAAGEVSSQSISAERQIEKVEPVKIEQMIKWLEEIWLDPETRKFIDEDTWLKFIESLKEEL
jgi:parallel beta-helix repeat protein